MIDNQPQEVYFKQIRSYQGFFYSLEDSPFAEVFDTDASAHALADTREEILLYSITQQKQIIGKAEAEIFRLSALREVAAMSDWISVNDLLPGDDGVIVWDGGEVSYAMIAVRDEGGIYWYNNGPFFQGVTHWMPLPKPPLVEQ